MKDAAINQNFAKPKNLNTSLLFIWVSYYTHKELPRWDTNAVKWVKEL